MYPTDEQQRTKEHELYQSYFSCPGTICEALGNMSEKDALFIANGMNADLVAAQMRFVVRKFCAPMVERDMVEWINSSADEEPRI